MNEQDNISPFNGLADIMFELYKMHPPTPDNIGELKEAIDNIFRNATDDTNELIACYEHDIAARFISK
jgi:hypothetical protein